MKATPKYKVVIGGIEVLPYHNTLHAARKAAQKASAVFPDDPIVVESNYTYWHAVYKIRHNAKLGRWVEYNPAA